ncbi:tetratricopeptide repeat protein [Photobacterium sp. SDRW27]|uniref:tetratricopeptide repeat protein n=1 Tax=Photobacterium obscurum TaxID=2829490 RepID=UPI0022441711|nr:tetratricopeptide repeat protein [Photobacterium obscurum]MCW8327422.1 tetratricopeptide repeat protein [Photobacterium obscurum]
MKKLYILLLTALLLSGCVTQPLPDKTEANLIAAKNYQGLTDYYKSQLQHSPDNKELMAKLTGAYFKIHDLESAQFYTRYLLKLGYSSPDFLYLAGNVFMASEQYSQAIDTLIKAQVKGYEKSKLNISLGIAYSNQGEFELAQNQFNMARLKGHDDITVKNNLAVLYIVKQQPDEAIRILTPVYQAYPDNDKVKMNLAVALIKSKDYVTARQLLKSDYSDEELIPLMQSIKAL